MQIDAPVLAALSRATATGNALTLAGQLDRKLYEQVAKVIEAAGGKWNRKAGAHLFATDASDRLEQILATGEVDLPKDEFNFFPSPAAVVARLLELARLRTGMSVLEPSAGRGDIAVACILARTKVTAHELMDANADFLISLSDFDMHVVRGDFLAAVPTEQFDRVVMNPPFMKQQDIRHVMHALKFLKPGGLLVSVMSASVAFRDNRLTQAFRDLVHLRGGDIEDLPPGSFKASGTMVNTVIVTIPGAAA